MSKGKRRVEMTAKRESQDPATDLGFGTPSPYPRWWFEDQHEMNRLIIEAMVGTGEQKDDLRRVSDFLYTGRAQLGQLIPETLAKSSYVAFEVTPDAAKICEYPTVLNWLEFFGGDDKVFRCKKDEKPDILLYVASTNTWGIRAGEVMAVDADRPWKCDGVFAGVVLSYKIVKEV